MELEAEDGTRIRIDRGSKTEVGRGQKLGFGPSAADRTISRRHLSMCLLDPTGDDAGCDDSGGDFMVSFEVTGKNPILVRRSGGEDKRVYRNSEKGELRAGDRFSLSLKNPSFFVLWRNEGRGEAAEVEKRVLDAVERRERRTLERRKEKERRARAETPGAEGDEEDTNGGLELELGSLDVSQIDPVREFGFLVRGHEFDNYPKQKIRPIGDWKWFLEDPGGDSDDELTNEATCPRGKVRRRKNKRGRGSEDENWSGESEEEKVLVTKLRSSKRPSYSTRSKDAKKRRRDASGGRHPALLNGVKAREDEDIEEDEDDETLEGFIVDDEEEVGEEEEEAPEEDLEEDEEEEEEDEEEE